MSVPLRRGNKYRAVKTEIDGIVFDSKKEARRWLELQLLERAGEIHGLMRQPRYELHAYGSGTRRIGEYRGDFLYCQCARPGGKCWSTDVVCEDVKGIDTALSKWKRKHVAAQYQIDVKLV